MSNVKQTLLEMNADLFSMRQPSKDHDIFVVGRKEKDPNDPTKFKINYLLRSKPNKLAVAANIKPQDFIHASFKPVGTIIESEGRKSYKGPKKAKTGVVFLNTQPDLYNFIKQSIEEGEGKGYTLAGFDAQKRPMIKLVNGTWGLKVGFNTPLYTPHSLDSEGNPVALRATSYNPKTGKYTPEKVVIGYYEFFADEDDLDKLLEICARHYSKNVEPHLAERTTTIKEKGNEKTVKVEEEKITAPVSAENIIFDEEGNSVDENGEVLETAEDLLARGIEKPEE